ncbi:MarR family winged helix-turn-helix transcriptional regulator [Paraburkholderia sp. 32]|uniref:MarR family winged helix-turn-helix transcriptional regulator n=1 Tax=Paraburkholderia sp. 32 TaxID=2991057 RepID=UPI003D2110E2
MLKDETHGLVFMRTARYISRVYNRHLANVSLSASQHGILEAVGRLGPVTLQDVTNDLMAERSAVQRTLQPLIKQQLLRATADPAHKKRLLFQLTDDGRQRLDSSAACISSAEAEIEGLFEQSKLPNVCFDWRIQPVDATH